jgi:multicomponent K+:H+ antiporter subunit A
LWLAGAAWYWWVGEALVLAGLVWLVFARKQKPQLVVSGRGLGGQWVEQRLRTDFLNWIGAGLLIAGGAGIGSWLLGAPFLTSTYAYWTLPVLGAVPLASAVIFDLGVYLTVVGATMVALVSIGRVSAAGEERQ